MFFRVEGDRLFFEGKDSISFQDIVDAIDIVEDDVVYIGGSLVEGFLDKFSKGMGNPYSDIDVFIIRKHQAFEETVAEYSVDVRKTYFRDIKGNLIDIEVFSDKYVCDLCDALANVVIDKDTRLLNLLGQGQQRTYSPIQTNTFLNRFNYSICIYNEMPYNEIKVSMAFDTYLKLKVQQYIALIDNNIEDIQGNLKAGEPDAALYSLRFATMNLMIAILSHEGIFVDRDKWVALKFANLARISNKYDSTYKFYSEVFRGDMIDDTICLERIKKLTPILKRETEKILTGGLEI